MAGLIDDDLYVYTANSQEEETVDLPIDKAKEKAMQQSVELLKSLNNLEKTTNGIDVYSHLGAQFINKKEDFYNDILQDYSGMREGAIDIAFRADTLGVRKIGGVAITPENVDKLIALVNDTTEQGKALKDSMLKASGAKDITSNESAKVELLIRHNLRNKLQELEK